MFKKFLAIFGIVFILTGILDLGIIYAAKNINEYKLENFESGTITYKIFKLPEYKEATENPYYPIKTKYYFDLKSDEGYTRLVNVDANTYYEYNIGDQYTIPKE